MAPPKRTFPVLTFPRLLFCDCIAVIAQLGTLFYSLAYNLLLFGRFLLVVGGGCRNVVFCPLLRRAVFLFYIAP